MLVFLLLGGRGGGGAQLFRKVFILVEGHMSGGVAASMIRSVIIAHAGQVPVKSSSDINPMIFIASLQAFRSRRFRTPSFLGHWRVSNASCVKRLV